MPIIEDWNKFVFFCSRYVGKESIRVVKFKGVVPGMHPIVFSDEHHNKYELLCDQSMNQFQNLAVSIFSGKPNLSPLKEANTKIVVNN